MARVRKSKFLYKGQEVTTDDGLVAVVDTHNDMDEVLLRHYEPNWPFPKWTTKNRRQLTIVPLQYEEAPF